MPEHSLVTSHVHPPSEREALWPLPFQQPHSIAAAAVGERSVCCCMLPIPVLIDSLSWLLEQAFGLHYKSGKATAMEEALKQLCDDVEKAVRGGLEIVLLSDRIGKEDMDIETPPIPTLLAVGAVHHHLIRCASIPFHAADALCIGIRHPSRPRTLFSGHPPGSTNICSFQRVGTCAFMLVFSQSGCKDICVVPPP